MDFAARIVQAIDDGGAITVLGGVHIGCYELFAKEGVRGIGELKGKSVGLKTSPRAPSVPRALWGFSRGVRLGEVGQSARPDCFASQDVCG